MATDITKTITKEVTTNHITTRNTAMMKEITIVPRMNTMKITSKKFKNPTKKDSPVPLIPGSVMKNFSNQCPVIPIWKTKKITTSILILHITFMNKCSKIE